MIGNYMDLQTKRNIDYEYKMISCVTYSKLNPFSRKYFLG